MLSEQPEFETPRPVSQMLRWVVLAVLLGLTIVILTSQQFRRPPVRGEPEPPHPAVGRKLEHLSLQPLTGGNEALGLEGLTGKVALINIWGTWCGPCVQEFPHLVELVEHYHDEPEFQFVSISCSHDGDDSRLAADTEAFLKEQRASFLTFADPTRETRAAIAQLAGEPAVPYPTTLILGRDGKVRALWFGFREGLTSDMRAVIDAALAEKSG
jgi:thiol-disulfide isomerase/thioredoxin